MSIYAHYELLIRIRFVIMYGYYSIKNLLGLLQKNIKPPTKLQSQLPPQRRFDSPVRIVHAIPIE